MLTLSTIPADVLAEVRRDFFDASERNSSSDVEHDRRRHSRPQRQSTILRLSDEQHRRRFAVRCRREVCPVDRRIFPVFRPVLISLLYTMVAGEKQPFPLRIAILYCFQCYLYKNDYGRSLIIQTLLPQTENGKNANLRLAKLGAFFSRTKSVDVGPSVDRRIPQ